MADKPEKMFKKFVLLFSFLLTFALVGLLFSRPVSAAVNCTTQYGGGQTCVSTGQLLVNKKIWDPINKVFVDNLSASVKSFVAGDEVTFTIEIKNAGDATIHNVNFTDTLPSFLVWSGGDPLNFTIGDMLPSAVVTRTIKAKVIAEPGNQCAVNTVLARSNEGTDQDMAQLCVGQLPKAIPQAGPEMGILAMLPGLAGIGLYLGKLGKRGN